MPDQKQFTSKGFTLMEVMIVIAVLTVMAGLAIPTYQNSIEQTASKEPEVNLKTIYMAERIYRVNNGSYWNGGANPAIADINTNLNIELSPPQYYPITSVTTGGGGTTFTVQATRNGGIWNGRTASITEQPNSYTAP